MASFLVYRHGSNAANQSSIQTMAVMIVEAKSRAEAFRIAHEKVNCYNNQHLELVAKSALNAEQREDWNSLLEQPLFE